MRQVVGSECVKQIVSPERVKQVAGLKTTLRASRESFRVLSEGFESSEVPHQPPHVNY